MIFDFNFSKKILRQILPIVLTLVFAEHQEFIARNIRLYATQIVDYQSRVTFNTVLRS